MENREIAVETAPLKKQENGTKMPKIWMLE